MSISGFIIGIVSTVFLILSVLNIPPWFNWFYWANWVTVPIAFIGFILCMVGALKYRQLALGFAGSVLCSIVMIFGTIILIWN